MKLHAVSALTPVLSLVLLGCSGSQPKTENPSAPAPKASAKAEPKAAPASASKSEPVAAPKAAPKPLDNAQDPVPAAPKAEPVAATEPPKAEPKAEPKPEPKTEPKAEPKTEPKPVSKTDPKAAKGGEAVAVVDGEKITRAEFDAFIVKVTGGRPIPPEQKLQAENQIITMFINQKLLKKFIDTQKVEIDEEALFDAKLRTYLQNLSSGGPKTDAEALALAKSIRKELDGGADFAALAKKHSVCPSKSKGGDLGEFTAERMVQPFSDAVKAMKVNDLSEPVKTEFGYHVIQRLPLAAGSPKDSLHARHILVKVAEGSAGPESLQKNFQKLVDELRGKAKIENKLPVPPPAPMGMPGMPGMPGDDE